MKLTPGFTPRPSRSELSILLPLHSIPWIWPTWFAARQTTPRRAVRRRRIGDPPPKRCFLLLLSVAECLSRESGNCYSPDLVFSITCRPRVRHGLARSPLLDYIPLLLLYIEVRHPVKRLAGPPIFGWNILK